VVPIRYIPGDATRPVGDGPKVIAHVCNNVGGWGRGFVVAVSRRWPQPEADYRAWSRAGLSFTLGAVRLVRVDDDMWVANMIGQQGLRSSAGRPPIRYDAVDNCLTAVAEHAARLAATVHMPRIGCGLAGGTWDRIEPLIAARLSAAGIPVTVYDYS
jgi:O-acetyl-ADP-ribose deacetylase (regulator of RNase III)